MEKLRQYAALKPDMPAGRTAAALCDAFSLSGTEVYFDDLVPRDEPLCPNSDAEAELLARLTHDRVKRAHASYWAWPTAFLTGRNREELFRRMGGAEEVRAYFGDESGERIFSRWTAEYALCVKAGLESYTFHLIDYAPVDGKWAFTLTRAEILAGMAEMLARFLERLNAAGLLSANGPRIELENAGWGLEYGAQTCEDFLWVLSRVEDTFGLLRVAWDVNHLLHAVGRERFLLPEEEITPAMGAMEGFGLPLRWLQHNLLNEDLLGRVGAVHLSDRPVTDTAWFLRGKLAEPWYSELNALHGSEAQEEYGVKIVLERYDAHIPLGTGGYLDGAAWRALLTELKEKNGGFALLHELKNSNDMFADLTAQRAALGGTEL